MTGRLYTALSAEHVRRLEVYEQDDENRRSLVDRLDNELDAS